MIALTLYLSSVLQDGDYLSDWLTHLPRIAQPYAELLGFILATLTGR